jgi:hypothetical protein
MGHFTITQFGSDTTPDLGDLDENFEAFGVLAPIPCSVSGTNTLTLTQNQATQASSVALTAYENYVAVCGVAAATNSGAATAQVGTLSALNIYKDTLAGPAALTGGEIVAGNAFTLVYDSELNSSAGGWHLISTTANVGSTITPSLVRASTGLQVGATTNPTLTAILSASATLTYTSIVPGSSEDQSFTMSGLSITDVIATGLPLPVSTGLSYSAYVTNAGTVGVGTVTIRALNATSGSTITPGTITVQAKAIRTV